MSNSRPRALRRLPWPSVSRTDPQARNCIHYGCWQIYKLRPLPGKGGTLRRGSMLHCKAVAPKYGVTPKTIRDVWSGRSWAEATRHLWTEEEIKVMDSWLNASISFLSCFREAVNVGKEQCAVDS